MLISAVRAEFRKISSTRLWWILVLILFIYVASTAGGLAALLGAIDSGVLPQEAASSSGFPNDPLLIYSFGSSIGFVFPVIFGAICVTQEFRHNTITPTFLASPSRGTVLTAKVLTLAVWGAFFGVIATVASAGVGAATFAAFGMDTGLNDASTWGMLARMILALSLWGVIGVGLGSLIPSQVGSIIVVVVFTQFVEPLLRLAAGLADWSGEIGKFLPGAANDALVGASFYNMFGAADSLPWWGGGLALLTLGLVVTVAGYLLNWRRDVR